MPTLTVGDGTASPGAFGTVLAGIAIVWAINLTNFMDGIDGLATTEAATVALTGAALLAPVNPPLAAAAAVTGGAALGFLPWNWQRATVFLGDAGSGFLGYMLATLALASERAGAVPVLGWLILYATFAVDGTVTVIRRAARGERWYAAHRSHAYQRAVLSGWSHARVTVTVLILNVGLGILAWAAVSGPNRLGLALLASLALCGGAYAGVERLLPMGHSPAPHMDKASG
jgi:Fuc2NAc and GlcNAc transferase